LLKVNWLSEKLKTSTKPCIGTWITIPSPETLDVICSTGPDFVVIDTEHAPIGLESAQRMAITCTSRQVSPVLRVPGVDESRILRSLETGVHAVQVPNIGSKAQTQSMVSFAKYQPIGSKGLSPFTRACDYSADNSAQMVDMANQNTLLIAQVEGKLGIDNIDDILSVENIDIVFIGMFDLSNYLGIPGELNHPRLRAQFLDLAKKISDSGLIVGSISNNIDQLKFLIDSGARYITHSADCHILSNAYKQIFQKPI
jgi:4-hydroxy-2-oxoheptanedioate aldolase